MHSKTARLDRFVSAKTGINRKDVRLMLAQQRISVDGHCARDIHQLIYEFSHVLVDDRVLQANTPIYIMLNKPLGVVSATKDAKNKTVIDVISRDYSAAILESLHIVGRLDFNSSGLLLLTNDGRWSRSLSEPDKKVEKLYRVTVANPLTKAYVDAFEEGMYFPYEDITTKPATLEIVSDYIAQVSLIEGRYHQIKRMFGRFQNPVLELHRTAVGNLVLDTTLAAGESRLLSAIEVATIQSPLRS